MLPAGYMRRSLLCAGLLGLAAGLVPLVDGAGPGSGTAAAVQPRPGLAQPRPDGDARPVPKGRHMEAVSDAVAEQTSIPAGTELLVGPGRLDCHRDNICVLRDEDDQSRFLVFGIGSLKNGQRDFLIENRTLADNPVAARLLRLNRGGTAYQGLQVIDARTRETIGLQ